MKHIKILGVLLVIVFLLILLLSWGKQNSVETTLVEKKTADTTLSLSPNPVILKTSEGTIDITIDTGNNTINFVQITLQYDSKFLNDIKITKGSFMEKGTVLNTFINKEKGTITYIIALPKKDKPLQGKGTIATLSFQTNLKRHETTILSFTKDTLITSDTAVQTLLKKAVGTTLIKQE